MKFSQERYDRAQSYSEKFLEAMENIRLLKLAESRSGSNTTDFEDFIKQEGFSIEELEELSESVEF